ncbi:MAG: hypothetical protein ACK2UK_19215 [Candidatus Promineifilaceae bacterium]
MVEFTSPVLSQKRIFWFWLPLFASWLLMTAEGPFVSAVINRLPDEVVMLAAQGIVVSLMVLVESPIINLLATSTALVHDNQSYRLVRRFTIHWAIFLTVISIFLAFTPLFNVVVVQLLQTPEPVARWVRPGLQIMILWSAAIAWRRFLQGILIHFGHTRRVAWGTAVRLVSSAGTAAMLGFSSSLPGVVIGASALMVGVITEAAYATLAVRPVLRDHLSPNKGEENNPEMTYRQLFWFHLPLAGTSVLTLLAQPLVTSSLARLANPTVSLAAWPVVFQITLMSRAAAFAWPEVVIALTSGPATFSPLRRFTFGMGATLTGAMALFVLTPLSAFYIFVVQDMTPLTGELARSNLALFLLFPALTVFISWLRGLLIKQRVTSQVNLGMAINLVVTGLLLLAGVLMQRPGLPTAAIALNLAAFCEVLYLAWKTNKLLSPQIQLFGRQQPLAF